MVYIKYITKEKLRLCEQVLNDILECGYFGSKCDKCPYTSSHCTYSSDRKNMRFCVKVRTLIQSYINVFLWIQYLADPFSEHDAKNASRNEN